MPRFILIDSNSGYIFGDTSDFAYDREDGMEACTAASLLDRSIGEHGRQYMWRNRAPNDNRTGYLVYRAGEDGDGLRFPVVENGQDQETIDRVIRECEFECFVEVLS